MSRSANEGFPITGSVGREIFTWLRWITVIMKPRPLSDRCSPLQHLCQYQSGCRKRARDASLFAAVAGI
ncbi:hypothetical protein KCP69_14015 [Salmonella enterica subsp. enterica]|nr:hypothetical protein KCP69_14015 [Salmonella enterica subsp. enterica]